MPLGFWWFGCFTWSHAVGSLGQEPQPFQYDTGIHVLCARMFSFSVGTTDHGGSPDCGCSPPRAFPPVRIIPTGSFRTESHCCTPAGDPGAQSVVFLQTPISLGHHMRATQPAFARTLPTLPRECHLEPYSAGASCRREPQLFYRPTSRRSLSLQSAFAYRPA